VQCLGLGSVPVPKLRGGCDVKRNGDNKVKLDVVRCGVVAVARGGGTRKKKPGLGLGVPTRAWRMKVSLR
jgi:hypothetical protein